MRPLRFKPHSIGTIWGSEDWILSAMENRQSVCIASPLDSDKTDEGLTLSQLVSKYGERLVGNRVWAQFGGRFPLLFKYINANQQLSVQVHPDDSMAERKGLGLGKTEMWYVLDAKKDAEILVGFNRRFDAGEFCSIVHNSIQDKDALQGEKNLEDVLNRFYAQKGDWYFIPAGTVHSIGAGLRILEIQQASDTTFRLYDFNRVDAEGKRRHLDVEDAIEAVDFAETQEDYVEVQRNVFNSDSSLPDARDGSCKAPLGRGCVPLARCPHFVCNFINFDIFCRPDCGIENFCHIDNSKWGSFTVIVCTAGSGSLFYSESALGCIKEKISVKEGELYLIPAELGAVDICSDGGLQLVETHIEPFR